MEAVSIENLKLAIEENNEKLIESLTYQDQDIDDAISDILNALNT